MHADGTKNGLWIRVVVGASAILHMLSSHQSLKNTCSLGSAIMNPSLERGLLKTLFRGRVLSGSVLSGSVLGSYADGSGDVLSPWR